MSVDHAMPIRIISVTTIEGDDENVHIKLNDGTEYDISKNHLEVKAFLNDKARD